jgi:hypothetical protein
MELIMLGLGGSIGAVLSQLLEFIGQWRSAAHRPPFHRPRPNVAGNGALPVKLPAAAFPQRLHARFPALISWRGDSMSGMYLKPSDVIQPTTAVTIPTRSAIALPATLYLPKNPCGSRHDGPPQ